MEGVISYTEASEMSHDEILEANAALDRHIELCKQNSGK